MSFSSDLLDGFDTLNKRTEGLLKSGGYASEFFKSLSKVEKEYAKELKSLASKQKASLQKASASQKELATMSSSWDVILTELEKIADHHMQYSQNVDNDVSKPIAKWVKDKTVNRNKLEADSEKIRKDMKRQMDALSSARSKYVTSSKDADSCEATHTKGKGDINMKPAALAKLAQKSTQAADKAAVSDTEYQAALSLTNQKQSEFYLTIQPALLGEFQAFEEDRLQTMKGILEKFTDLFSEIPPTYSASSDSMSSSSRSISVDSDVSAYVSDTKTGVSAPPDIQYTSYDSDAPAPGVKSPQRKSTSTNGTIGAPVAAPRGSSDKAPGKYNYGKDSDILANREWGLSSSDRSLPDHEKRSKLNSQLEELDKAITSETKKKEGLENLVRFYASDPVQQKKAEDEIVDCEQKLSKLHDTKNKVNSESSQFGGSGGGGPSAPAANAVQVRGLYNYTATCDTELSFQEGDILTVTEQDDSGWWYAEINGVSGFVPNNYVKVI